MAELPTRYCTRCRKPVPPERVAHGSPFCGTDCRIADKRERREVKAGKTCRLCGRRFNLQKPANPDTGTRKGRLGPASLRATGAQVNKDSPNNPEKQRNGDER